MALEAATSQAQRVASEPTAERRITTVLFGDLVGFTSLSENRDAEDVRELLSRYFAGARTVVERYGGTVEKFIGDAVMAVWGVPTAHEDDAERAVRSGLELIGMTEALGQDVGVSGLSMRVGLVTGEVAVTLGATGEGMVAGDAVNTASRVQSTASPGRVWVDDTTRALTSAAIAYDDVGERELKGKARPVRLFAARAVVGSVRGTERVDGLEAPITGRGRELRLLKELFHSAEGSVRPSLVVVEGEPGVGKSRIGWEFEKYIDGLSAKVRWHRGRCLAYGDGVAFWALAEAVRARLGLVEEDTGAVVGKALDAGLDRYVADPEERAWLRPRLAVLIGADQPSSFAREDLFAAWTAFLERVAEGHVVVLLIDDAQHADEGLLDFLEHLLATARAAVFVLALARTGLIARRPDLAANRRATVLHLEALDAPQMSDLLDGLVEGLPDAARTLLIERSEGVPLFAVETVRALIDRDIVVPRDGRYVLVESAIDDLARLAAPASLQALVAARLDGLTASERRVVANGTVLGASFTRGGIGALATDMDVDELDETLKGLVRKQILSVETDRFSSERGQYRFVQAVVRQVAYDTLSRRDRKAKHLAVAAHMEQQVDAVGDNSRVLAQHYLDAVEASSTSDTDRGELLFRATSLLERAATRAATLGAPGEALRHLTSALQFVESLADQARLHEAAAEAANNCSLYGVASEHGLAGIAAYEALGDQVGGGRAAALAGTAFARGVGDNAKAIDLMQPHWDRLVGRAGAEEALILLAYELARAHQDRAEIDEAQPFLERHLRLAEASGNPQHVVSAHLALGFGYANTRAPLTALSLYKAAAELAREQRLPASLARALMNSATEILPRDVQQAIEVDREALASAKQSGVVTYVLFSAANLCLALWTGGGWDELTQVLSDHADPGADPATVVIFDVLQSWVADARGTPSKVSVQTLEQDNQSHLAWTAHQALLLHRQTGELSAAAESGDVSVKHALAWAALGDDFMHFWPAAVEAAIDAHDLDLAERLLGPVVDSPPGLITPALSSQLLRLRGLIGVARGNDAAATEADLRAAVDALEEYGAVPVRARTQEALGRWLLSQGRTAEAEEQLARARHTYAELKATAWLDALAETVPTPAV